MPNANDFKNFLGPQMSIMPSLKTKLWMRHNFQCALKIIQVNLLGPHFWPLETVPIWLWHAQSQIWQVQWEAINQRKQCLDDLMHVAKPTKNTSCKKLIMGLKHWGQIPMLCHGSCHPSPTYSQWLNTFSSFPVCWPILWHAKRCHHNGEPPTGDSQQHFQHVRRTPYTVPLCLSCLDLMGSHCLARVFSMVTQSLMTYSLIQLHSCY